VSSRGPDLREALHRVYQACTRIHFEGMHYRRDIAAKPLRLTK
jgi:phosphoribosylamine--glycine ligase